MSISLPGTSPFNLIKSLAKSATLIGSPISKTNISPLEPIEAANEDNADDSASNSKVQEHSAHPNVAEAHGSNLRPTRADAAKARADAAEARAKAREAEACAEILDRALESKKTSQVKEGAKDERYVKRMKSTARASAAKTSPSSGNDEHAGGAEAIRANGDNKTASTEEGNAVEAASTEEGNAVEASDGNRKSLRRFLSKYEDIFETEVFDASQYNGDIVVWTSDEKKDRYIPRSKLLQFCFELLVEEFFPK